MITLNSKVAESYQAILATTKKVMGEERFAGDIIALIKKVTGSNDYLAHQYVIALFSIGLVRPICGVICPPFTAELLKPEKALENSKYLYRVYRVDYKIQEEQMKKKIPMGPTTSQVLATLKDLPTDKDGWTLRGSIAVMIASSGLTKGQVKTGLACLIRNGYLVRRGSTTSVQYRLEAVPTQAPISAPLMPASDDKLVEGLKKRRVELARKLAEIDECIESLSAIDAKRQQARELLQNR